MSYTSWRDTGLRHDFAGHSIFYQRAGDGADALLLIHGFPTASWDWEPLWPGLSARYPHVIAPDLLGFGFSDKPHPHAYSLLEQTELCLDLLRSCGVERVHLLAHDYGVSIAQELLARANAGSADSIPVLSVVFLNGGLFPDAMQPTLTQRLLHSPLGALIARMMSERRFARVFVRIFGAQTQPTPIELHDWWELITGNQGRRIMPALIRYLSERKRHRARWTAALVEARIPMRLIVGDADPVSGSSVAQRYAQLVPDADVVRLEGIGHYPHVEAADRTLRAVLAFQRKHFSRTDAAD